MTSDNPFTPSFERIGSAVSAAVAGTVDRVTGLALECRGLRVPVGALCELHDGLTAEVVGLREGRAILMGHGSLAGVSHGDAVRVRSRSQRVPVGDALLGRVVDASSRPIDDKGPLFLPFRAALHRSAPAPMTRRRILRPLGTGVRAIDALTTCGRGQRVGLFSGSGVGKSVLMGMIARGTDADVSVIALVGERGREVREFIERDLGEEGLRRSVVVVATGDEPALVRIRAAYTATAVAEYFRDQGSDVLLLMDSLTRLSLAQREVGLSAGEPPATKGYPPSVFAMMPRLLERAGQSDRGSITGIYTVLVEGDDLADPVADTARSILDGHVTLSRDLANRGHFPAVDPLGSVSRLMTEVATPEHRQAAVQLTSILAVHRDAEDMINIGAYAAGSSPDIDRAVRMMPAIRGFLRQDLNEISGFDQTVRRLQELVALSAPSASNRGGAA